MKYAIVESGGKQYKAVEGEPIEVDRLPVNAGDKVGLERVLMLVDGEEITVGTPTVDGVQVNTTVTEHFKGPKIIVFKYSPRKRIRVKSGHRQQYTRLMVDVIGTSGKASKAKKAEAKTEKKVEKKEATAAKPAAQKAEKAPAKKTPAKKAPAKKTEKASAKTTAKKAPAKKTEKAPAKKTTTKKTTTKKSSSTKKTEK